MPPTLIFPRSISQKRAAGRETVVLPPPEGPTSAAALIAQLFLARLYRAIQNRIHTLDITVRRNNASQVLQRALQRIIQARGHQQKEEKGQNIQLTLDQQCRADQCRRRNAKP